MNKLRFTKITLWCSAASLLVIVLAAQYAVSQRILPPEPVAGDKFAELVSAIEKERQKGLSTRLADNLFDLGISYNNCSNYTKAISCLTEALQVEQHLQRPKSELETRVALATVYLQAGDLEQSKKAYEEALAFARQHKLGSEMAASIINLGNIALVQKDQVDEAGKIFQQAYDMAAAAESETENTLAQLSKQREQGAAADARLARDKALDSMASALIQLAEVDRKRNQYEAGLEKLKTAANLYEKSGAEDKCGYVLQDIGVFYQEMGHLKESTQWYEKAKQTFVEQLEDTGLASVEWSIAENFYISGQLPEARAAYQHAVELSRTSHDNGMLAKALLGLGTCEADLGNFTSAESLHQEALQATRANNNLSGELEALMQLGNDALLKGQPEVALNQLLEATKKVKALPADKKTKGNILIALGRCYAWLGQVNSATNCCEEALKLFAEAHLPEYEALALNTLSVIYLDNLRLDDFNRVYQKAKTQYLLTNNPREAGTLEYNWAQSQVIQAIASGALSNKIAEAIPTYQSALAKMREAHDVAGECTVLRGLGLAELLAKQPQQSLEHYQLALQLAERSKSIEALWDANLGLGKVYRELGQNTEAYKYLKQAVDLVEKERSMLSRDSFKTHNLDMRQDCYLELVGLLAEMNRPYESLEIAEKGKARAFLDLLAKRQNRQIETIVAPVQQVQAIPSTSLPPAAPHRGERSVAVTPKAGSLVETTTISPLYVEAPSIEEIQNIVRKRGSTCVEYFLLPNKLVIWVIDPDTTIHLIPPIPISQSDLQGKISSTIKLICSQPKTPQELAQLGVKRQKILQDLYKILLAPVEQYLPKAPEAQVTIIPYGALFLVPFAALVGPDGSYVIEKHTLSFSPALGVLRATQELQSAVASLPHKLLAFGNPITQQTAFLGALPYAEKEVKEVAQLYGSPESMVKIGADATKVAFEQLAPNYTDIHLATHGLIDEEHPMDSGLVLAPTPKDDGMLYVKDIIALKDFKARLVVLSACQTARGKISGDGVVGLSRAFIIAGTPSVLVSQWNVDDVITKYQMAEFYKAYLKGADKAKSLRNAQLATIKLLESGLHTDSSTQANARANPKYWAAFQLLGETAP